MGLFGKLARMLGLKRDRGLIFEAYGEADGRSQFLGYLVTEHKRSAQPIGFVPMDVYFLRDETDDECGMPLVSMFDIDRMRFVDYAEKRVRFRIAQRVAADHRLAVSPGIHPDVVGMRGILSEDKDDLRASLLPRLAFLPACKMPPHFSPSKDWQGCYSPGIGMKGPLMFGVLDREVYGRTPQRKSGTSALPIVPTPAKHLGQKALETTAA
jgi:hypothetical protein